MITHAFHIGLEWLFVGEEFAWEKFTEEARRFRRSLLWMLSAFSLLLFIRRLGLVVFLLWTFLLNDGLQDWWSILLLHDYQARFGDEVSLRGVQVLVSLRRLVQHCGYENRWISILRFLLRWDFFLFEWLAALVFGDLLDVNLRLHLDDLVGRQAMVLLSFLYFNFDHILVLGSALLLSSSWLLEDFIGARVLS